MPDTKTIPSGFPIIDLLTGGYPAGELVVVRFIDNEFNGDMAQDFLLRQALNLAASRKTLLTSLSMNAEEIARSYALMGKDVINEITGTDPKLYISDQDDYKKLPGIRDLVHDLKKFIAEKKMEAIFIDAIDEIIPDDPSDDATSVSIFSYLRNLARETRTVVFVTDYDNKLETHPEGLKVERNLTEIELNKDVNDIVQAHIHREGKHWVINNLYPNPEDIAFELVRSVCKDTEARCFNAPSDKVSCLAVSAAMLINELKKELSNG